MKINFKSLLAGSLACFALIAGSCTKEGNPTDGPDKNAADGKGYFVLNIQDVTGNLSRADALVTDAGEGYESTINAIRVVLYDAATLVADVSWDVNMTTELLPSKVQTVAKEVEKKDYKMLVMLNPTAKAIAATVEKSNYSTFAAVRNDVSVDDLTGDVSGDGSNASFMMSNWQGLVNVLKADIYEKDTEAEASPVEVFVERAVSKLLVGYDSNTIDTPNATVSNLEWTVDVKSKKTYFMRVPAQAVTTPGTSYVLGTEYTNPLMRHRHYATDANFDGISWRDAGSAPAGGDKLDENFSYMTAATVFKELKSATKAGYKGVYTGEYLLENTMEAKEQYRDVTTAVVYKCKYSPIKSSIVRDPETDTKAIGEDVAYFVYKNYVLAAEDLDDIIAETIVIDESKILDDLATFLSKDNLETYLAKLPGGHLTFAAFAASGNESQTIDDLTFFDANQISYFRAPIRHYDEAIMPVKMAYGRFGVVRNNIYLLHLEKILGPGGTIPTKTPGGPGPGGPDEEEYGYISVKFEILPWVLREHGVNVGE